MNILVVQNLDILTHVFVVVTMDPVTLILLLMVLTLPIIYLLKSYNDRKRISALINQLPGPPAYPIVGTALDMLRAERTGK